MLTRALSYFFGKAKPVLTTTAAPLYAFTLRARTSPCRVTAPIGFGYTNLCFSTSPSFYRARNGSDIPFGFSKNTITHEHAVNPQPVYIPPASGRDMAACYLNPLHQLNLSNPQPTTINP